MGTLTSGKTINFHLGLLILRVGIGSVFMGHGAPKLYFGQEYWEILGKNMQLIGIDFAPAFWGLMAGVAEFGGGLCLMLGVFWIPACLLMIFTMLIATSSHIANGDSLSYILHPVEACFTFISLIFIGAGKYKLGK